MAKIKAKKSEETNNEKVVKKIVKEEKIRTEESETLHRFIVIFIVIIAIVIAIYFISSLVSSDDNNNNTNTNNTVAETSINYNIVTVGTILNRDQYKKYYVMVYDGEDNEASYYSAILSKYMAKKEKEKIYFCDLSNPLNKEYAKKESNPSAQKVEDFAFGAITLLEIQNGRITKYVEDVEQIKNILQ